MDPRLGCLLFLTALLYSGCASPPPSVPPAAGGLPWSTGFWFWQGSHYQGNPAQPLDLLYVQAGTITRDGVQPHLPEQLPPAREYWLVYRYESGGLPESTAIPILLASYESAANVLRQRKGKVAGLQLDIDSPTGSLPSYARYLAAVRKGLPRSEQLSITALLDWFRPGTAAGSVVDAVDEFVPQFYDTGGMEGLSHIAAPIDAHHWRPLLERFGKRYRIGISCFGRALEARSKAARGIRGEALSLFQAANTPELALSRESTPAGERLLRYTVTRPVRLGWRDYQPTHAFLFTLPTRDAIRRGYAAARQMGPHCAGVLFFRWPAGDDQLTLQPETVLRFAGLLPEGKPEPVTLTAEAGDCAAVACTRLLLHHLDAGAEQPQRLLIEGSTALEYFVPADGVPARLVGPRRVELRLPAFSGLTHLNIGTAVTARAATYRLLEGKP
jgi:hypothetical protein